MKNNVASIGNSKSTTPVRNSNLSTPELKLDETLGETDCVLTALFDGDELSRWSTGIDLSWSPDPLVRRTVMFHPMCDPPGQPPHSEQNGEHLYGNADGPIDDSGIEVDIGVEAAFDKVTGAQEPS